MIKKLVLKLKNIFGTNQIIPKDVPAKVKHGTEITTHQNSSNQKEKPGIENAARKLFKKETREEYRLRHEKKIQNKPVNTQLQHSIQLENWDDSVFKVEVVNGKTRFQDLEISKKILHAIYDLRFQYCTLVQAETLPKSLSGLDVTVQAQTGTGKTAAFLITIFNHILKHPIEKKRKPGTPRALILAPTRELVLQIEKDARGLNKYIQLSILSILGGMDYKKQQATLHNQLCDLLICTPGRLIDFMQKHLVDLGKVEILIIDEADRMLDMGFIPAVKKIIIKTPVKEKRQTMFFSATLSRDVKRLAESWTRQAFEIIIKPENVAVESVEQITYITTIVEKPTLLYNLIMQKHLERVLVFVNRKDDAKQLKEKFERYGISCSLISGDVEQSQRIKRLENFREGKVRVLVATDVASRGIHIEAISHVINYNMPLDAEEYVHRIGRTGRAGASGVSISFADEDDSHQIQKLEEFLRKKIECKFPEEELLVSIPEKHRTVDPKRQVRKKYVSKNYKNPNRRK